jgi:hypothetical protein
MKAYGKKPFGSRGQNMRQIDENFDSFGLPALSEDRISQIHSEDVRTQLDRAKDEIRRALGSLRELQKQLPAPDRMGAAIRSAIISVLDCEKSLLTAIHRAEDVIHRVRKSEVQLESVNREYLLENEIEVDFEHGGKALVAAFDVEGTLEKDGRGGADWVKQPKVHMIGIYEKEDPNHDVIPSSIDHKLIEKLEDQAIERYADWYVDNVIYGDKDAD